MLFEAGRCGTLAQEIDDHAEIAPWNSSPRRRPASPRPISRQLPQAFRCTTVATLVEFRCRDGLLADEVVASPLRRRPAVRGRYRGSRIRR